MIRHDLPWTLGRLPDHAAFVMKLVERASLLREALAGILRAGDRAARGARLVEVHGQAVIVLGAEEWQAVRRAMIAAGESLTDERGPMN